FSLTNNFDLPLSIPAGGFTNIGLVYNASAAGAATNILTIYNSDVASHPFFVTNIARANPINGVSPAVQLTAPINGTQYSFPADVPITAVASCASNTTLASINFLATGAAGTVQIGQVQAAPGQSNLIGAFTWSRPA